MYVFVITEPFFHFQLKGFIRYYSNFIKISILKFLGLLNSNVIREFQNSK